MAYNKIQHLLIIGFLLVIFSATINILPPHVSSDSSTYLEAMDVLRVGEAPAGFIPNRILTTPAGLWSVLFVERFTRDTFTAWMIVNGILFLLAGYFFARLLYEIFGSRAITLIGAALFSTNYAVITFGLNYLMDMGGWAFYVMSSYGAWRYYNSGSRGDIYASALAAGVGGLFKEYALLGFLVLICAAAMRKSWRDFIPASFLALAPVAVWYMYMFFASGYSYSNWLVFNAGHYGESYSSRIGEYVKAFGSLYTFGWFLFLGGLSQWRKIPKFIWAVGASFLPIFVWPAITQRILFVSIPFVILVSCAFVKKREMRWLSFIPIIALYVVSMYAMDFYILPRFNLSDWI